MIFLLILEKPGCILQEILRLKKGLSKKHKGKLEATVALFQAIAELAILERVLSWTLGF